MVHPDVATPDDAYAAIPQRARKAGRLGVVEKGNVTGPHERVHGARVAVRRFVVHGKLGLSQRPSVASRAVQPIVYALGHAEECGVPSITTQRASTPAPRV